MGKKGVASTSSGKATLAKEESSFVQDSSEGVLTGIFASDVPLLCHQQDIPSIEVCGRYSECSSRFTFIIDSDVPDQNSFTTVSIRGWLITETVAKILSDALINCKDLSCIHLWNVGLSAASLGTIVNIILDHNIRELSLDGNNLSSTMPVTDILHCKSLVKLSMKSCCITDQFVGAISSHLAENGTLLHLNLSCNNIGDSGCTSLANSLRLNRTLLTLFLTGNSIGDIGVVALAKVLSRFPLSHDEVVQRRKLLSLQCRIEDGLQSSERMDLPIERGRISSPRGKSPTSTTALQKSLSKGDKVSGSKSKKGELKKDDKGKKEDKTKKTLESKKGKGGKDSKLVKRGDQGSESPHPDPPLMMQVNPLIELPVESENGHLYLPGNTTLVYLALSHNAAIGSSGMQSLLEALKMQSSKYSHLGSGLLKITLDHNSPRTDPAIMEEIESLLTKKKSDDRAEETGTPT